jgi:hypothetical protein
MVTIFLYVTPAPPNLEQPRAAYCSYHALLAWRVTVQTKDQHLECGVRQDMWRYWRAKAAQKCYRPSFSGIALLGMVSVTLELPG